MKNHLMRIFIFIFVLNIMALGYYIYFRNLIYHPKRPTCISDHPIILLSGRIDKFRAQGCWVLRYAGLVKDVLMFSRRPHSRDAFSAICKQCRILIFEIGPACRQMILWLKPTIVIGVR